MLYTLYTAQGGRDDAGRLYSCIAGLYTGDTARFDTANYTASLCCIGQAHGVNMASPVVAAPSPAPSPEVAELRYERLQNKLSSRERPALTLRWPSTYHWSASLTSDVPRVPVCLLPVAHNEDWVVRWDYC